MATGSLPDRLATWLRTHWSIGFGLEWLGYLALRHRRIGGLLVLAFTLLCASQVPRISVDADLMRVFGSSGPYYDRFVRLTQSFGTFESDAYLLVTSPNLTDPEVIETLRNLAFDLELTNFAAGTLSPFALRKPAGDGSTVPAVPENMGSPEEVAAVLRDLQANDPVMRNLILSDLSGMVMILFPDEAKVAAAGGPGPMIDELQALAAQYASADIDVKLTGPPVWTREMLDATNSDIARFTFAGFVLGAFISLVALRSVTGAILASLTPVVALIWVIGSVMMLFGSFTFLTNIVVTLVLVIAFAESMYFCFTWLRLWNDGLDGYAAIEEATRRVLPAAALTSLTTMVSFATLIVTQGRGIEEFGYSGVLGVGLAFVSFSTFMPLTMRLAVRFGFKPPRRMSIAVTAPIPVARFCARHAARPIAIASIVGALLLLIPHLGLTPSFSFDDFLPRNSEALETARGIDTGVGGVAPTYIRVPLKDGDPAISDADYARIAAVHRIAESVAGAGKVISATSLAGLEAAGFSRGEVLNAIGPFLKQRFVTEAGDQALVTAFLPTIMASEDLQALVANLEARLSEGGFGDAEVAGYRLMTTFASTDIINSIRNSLLAAIFCNIALIGIAFRSVRMGLVSFIPNVLPVLVTEAYLYFSGEGLALTSVIALTVAFGIAVDDTIHYLSTYTRNRRRGLAHAAAVDISLVRIGPALVATTLIICAGTAVVMLSSLPPVALFGTLTVITLIVALVGDLFVLPALLIAGGRFFTRSGEQT